VARLVPPSGQVSDDVSALIDEDRQRLHRQDESAPTLIYVVTVSGRRSSHERNMATFFTLPRVGLHTGQVEPGSERRCR
jgi:hypothetical protein